MCQHNRNVLHCPSLGKFMCFSSRDGQMEHAESHKSTGYNRKQEIRDRTPMCESLTNPPSPHRPPRLQTRTCLQWRKWKDTPGRCVFIWLRVYSDVRYCRSPNNANIHLHLCGPEERKSLFDSTCWLVQSQPHAGCFLRHLALFLKPDETKCGCEGEHSRPLRVHVLAAKCLCCIGALFTEVIHEGGSFILIFDSVQLLRRVVLSEKLSFGLFFIEFV